MVERGEIKHAILLADEKWCRAASSGRFAGIEARLNSIESRVGKSEFEVRGLRSIIEKIARSLPGYQEFFIELLVCGCY